MGIENHLDIVLHRHSMKCRSHLEFIGQLDRQVAYEKITGLLIGLGLGHDWQIYQTCHLTSSDINYIMISMIIKKEVYSMKMARLLIQVPKPIKAQLDALRSQGYTASGFIRALLEREFNQKEGTHHGRQAS